MSDKALQLRAVASKRRAHRWPGYRNIGDFHQGVYECDHVSPYTKSAGNVDADVFVLLQDWSSADHLAGPVDREVVQLGHTPGLPTNRNLVRLLRDFLGLELADVYATNLFPFIKPGSLSAKIPARHLDAAARKYALPQIEIVKPRLVVCLGVEVFRAMQRAAGHRPSRTLEAAVSAPFCFQSARIWCQAHTGGLGRANRNRGGVDRVSRDWLAMARFLQGGRSAA